MKKKITACALAALAAFTTFTACGKKGGGSSDIRFYLWSTDGGEPAGFSKVLNEFNSGAGKDLGVKLAFSFDTQNNYKQKLNLAMSAGETRYDVVFDAAWIYLSDFAKKDYYYNLEPYFQSDEYPGLKQAFDQNFLNKNKFNGGVYGIPLTQTFSDISVAYIRKDWRELCAADASFVKPAGISSSTVTADKLSDGIDDFEELEYYLYWIKQNKSGVVPALSNNDATWGAWDLVNTHRLVSKSANDYKEAGIKTSILVRQGVEATAYIKNDEVMAVGINDYLDPNAADGLGKFPAGFNTVDSKWQEDYEIIRRWQEDGIIDPDVMSVSDSDTKFEAGMGACVVQSINNFSAVEARLKANNPGAELEIFVNDPAVREKKSGYAQTDFKAWNYLCVPKTVSKSKLDGIMKFMDWLFKSEENHDLFQYGIKGVHWDVAKDENGNEIEGTVNTIGFESYTFPAYELTWNANYIRVQAASDPKVMEYMEYMFDMDRYVEIPYSDFTFDSQRTEKLISAVNSPLLATAISEAKSYQLGQIANPIAAWNSKLENRFGNVDLQTAMKTIQAEVKFQLQQFIDSL
ncbi:MAG: extracellular solute-binding protein [Clostridia bacterium]|nr:extracellular solute-binding protein [Clostridia bacterium]